MENNFQSRIVSWLNEQSSGLFAKSGYNLEIKKINEISCFRLVYKSRIENRKILPFSHPDKTPLNNEQPVTKEEFDIWSIQTDKAKETDERNFVLDVPQSLCAVACDNCKGDKKGICQKCNGEKNVPCEKCFGKGNLPCTTCQQTMRLPCRNCKSMGSIFDDKKQSYVLCEKCNGKGHLICSDCKEGYQICAYCKGEGKLSCSQCEGTGFINCSACLGEGQIVSGFSVDVSISDNVHNIDLPLKDVPENVKNKIMESLEWSKYKSVEFINEESLKEYGDSNLIMDEIIKLESKDIVNEDSRIINRHLDAEMKCFYSVNFRIKNYENTVWLTDSGIFYDKSPLENLYLCIVDDIKQNIKEDKLSSVQKLMESVKDIELLKPSLAEVNSLVRKKLIGSFLSGSIAGCIIFSVVMIFILLNLWSGSLHRNSLLFFGAILNLKLGMIIGFSIYKINPSTTKRFVYSCTTTLILLLIIYGIGAIFNSNPAKTLDKNALINEYNRHFPYGLRTLSSQQDINFLQSMVNKYTPTKIDLDRYKKELTWLKNKKISDDKMIKTIEATRKQIEDDKKQAYTVKKKKYRRKIPRITIQ